MGHQANILTHALRISILAAASTFSCFAVTPSPARHSDAEQYLLSAANRDRAAHGLSQLRLDPSLSQAALYHAKQMAAHGDISHQFPGEPELSTRGTDAGAHFSLMTENVAEAPDSVIIHDLWMHSEGHRENLLDPNVDAVGISVVTRDGQSYAVEDFASTAEPMTLDQQEEIVAHLLADSGLGIAQSTDDRAVEEARRTCSMPTGYAGHRQPWYILRYSADRLTELPTQLQSHLNSGRYHVAIVGACISPEASPSASYNIAILLYP
jgi:uncharacterized protein YkwD